MGAAQGARRLQQQWIDFDQVKIMKEIGLVMETRVPDLPSNCDNYRFGGNLTLTIRLPITKPETCNRSTTSPLGYQSCSPVDLATKANPCLRIEEHKQEQGRTQLKLQI